MANNLIPELEAESADFGILSPASVVLNTTSGAWETKLEYVDYTCNTETSIEGICIPGVTDRLTEKAVDNSSTGFMSEYRPFSIETKFKCSSFSMTPEEIEERAKKALEACRQKAIETEFSTGGLSKKITQIDSEIVNPFLSDGEADDLTEGSAVSPRVGLALLEQSLADFGCGTKGTIHAQPLAASMLSKHFKINKKEDALETRLGNYVVSGVGYTGASPVGTATTGTETYMYATGRTFVVLGDVHVYPSGTNSRAQSVNISNNTIEYVVSQSAAIIAGGCGKSAVLVDITK